MKIFFAFALLAIVAALFMAGRAMLTQSRDGTTKSKRMVTALAWRVGMSVTLFLVILVSYHMGWIHPTGIQSGR